MSAANALHPTTIIPATAPRATTQAPVSTPEDDERVAKDKLSEFGSAYIKFATQAPQLKVPENVSMPRRYFAAGFNIGAEIAAGPGRLLFAASSVAAVAVSAVVGAVGLVGGIACAGVGTLVMSPFALAFGDKACIVGAALGFAVVGVPTALAVGVVGFLHGNVTCVAALWNRVAGTLGGLAGGLLGSVLSVPVGIAEHVSGGTLS